MSVWEAMFWIALIAVIGFFVVRGAIYTGKL